MDGERMELLMQVDGMTCQGCVAAVTKTVRRVDPQAEVEVDLDHKRARIVTSAQALDIANALTKAGYEASAMTL